MVSKSCEESLDIPYFHDPLTVSLSGRFRSSAPEFSPQQIGLSPITIFNGYEEDFEEGDEEMMVDAVEFEFEEEDDDEDEFRQYEDENPAPLVSDSESEEEINNETQFSDLFLRQQIDQNYDIKLTENDEEFNFNYKWRKKVEREIVEIGR